MMRILFWIALALLVYFAVRSKLRSMALKQQEADRHNKALAEGEPMASCAHCHMYFPQSEAVHADGHDYCSPAHVRLPPK